MRVPIPKSPADRRRTSPRRALSRALVVLLAFGLLAAACGDDEPSTGDRKTIRIALDFFPNTNYAGIAAAIDKGYFEEQNLDVEIVPWAFTVTGILVENGNADLGIAYPPDTFREVALGNKVRTGCGDSPGVQRVDHRSGGLAVPGGGRLAERRNVWRLRHTS